MFTKQLVTNCYKCQIFNITNSFGASSVVSSSTVAPALTRLELLYRFSGTVQKLSNAFKGIGVNKNCNTGVI